MVSTGVIHMAAIISELGQGSNNQEVLTHMSGPSAGRAKNHWGLADLFSIFWVSLKSWASFSVRSLSLSQQVRETSLYGKWLSREQKWKLPVVSWRRPEWAQFPFQFILLLKAATAQWRIEGRGNNMESDALEGWRSCASWDGGDWWPYLQTTHPQASASPSVRWEIIIVVIYKIIVKNQHDNAGKICRNHDSNHYYCDFTPRRVDVVPGSFWNSLLFF